MGRLAEPVDVYARKVDAGKIIAGRPVRLAAARHLRDRANVNKTGLEWRGNLALKAIEFFGEMLILENGKPFVLEPFLAFIVGSIFGWYGPDGYRRFRTAYVEIGKGNGKTPTAAGIGLAGLVIDGEGSPEIYSAATTREQAKICFGDAYGFVTRNRELRDLVTRQVGSLAIAETHGVFRPVSSEHKGLDGLRVHMGLIDELHEHADPMVVEKIRAGTKGRRNALIFEITNSGYDRNTICWRHHEYSLKVLEDVIENDSWFAYVCALDKDQGDDYRNPAVWLKANPGLGRILPEKYLRERVAEAEGIPASENTVRRLNFCEWTEQATRAIQMDQWDQGDAFVDPAALAGRSCYGGLDLAKVSDLSAFVLLFPPEDEAEAWKVLCWFWVPEEDIRGRVQRDHVPYDVWQRDGFLAATSGNTTDYAFIQAKILELASRYRILEIAFDRTFAGEIVQALSSEGLTMVEFGQGFLSMAQPTAELLRLVKAGKLAHGGNPVLRWNASNLAVRLDPAGNMKPDKDRSVEKIDGIVALCNALGRAIIRPGMEPGSIYETRGALSFGL